MTFIGKHKKIQGGKPLPHPIPPLYFLILSYDFLYVRMKTTNISLKTVVKTLAKNLVKNLAKIWTKSGLIRGLGPFTKIFNGFKGVIVFDVL